MTTTTTAHVRACPYCEHRTPGTAQRAEANRRLADHIGSLHRDRLIAHREMERVLRRGEPIETARAAYNRTLLRLAGGPGTYDRHRGAAA